MAPFSRAAVPGKSSRYLHDNISNICSATRRRVHTRPSQQSAFFRQRYIDLTNEDDEVGEGIFIQNSPAPSDRQSNSNANQPRRNASITFPFKEIDNLRINGLQLAVGQTVEFRKSSDRLSQTEFLCVKHVLKDTKTGHVTLRGSVFRRVSSLQGMLTDHINEVVMIREVDEDDTRPKNYQSMVDVPLEDLVRNRRIVFTNEQYPRRSIFEDNRLDENVPNYYAQRDMIEKESVLVCRYVYTEHYHDAVDRQKNRRCTETVLRRLYQDEARDGLVTGTNQAKSCSSAPSINPFGKRASPDPSTKIRPLTYGSGCAGCGGDTTGAAMANFKIKYVWDQNGAALRTLLLNHSDTDAYEIEATNFVEGGLSRAICDLLHLSWPCQCFSPAKQKPGKDDEANLRAMFGTVEQLKASGALVHTQENTYGLLTHHPAYFCLLIEMIVRAGYNVRWKVLQLRDFGIAASRQRLIIIASK